MKNHLFGLTMMNKTWQDRCMAVAKLCASWSKDPSTKVGACLSRNNKRTLSTGFNRFPTWIEDTQENWNDRTFKYQRVIHAEMVALQSALEFYPRSVPGSTMVSSFPVCPSCMRELVSCGITRVVQPRLEDTAGFDKKHPEWVDQWKVLEADAIKIAESNGVEVVIHGQ